MLTILTANFHIEKVQAILYNFSSVPNEYLKNTTLSVILAFCAWFLFAQILGFKTNIVLTTAIFGFPHFLVATLGYFAHEPKKAVAPFAFASILAVIFALILKNINSLYLAQLIFFGYFLIHLLKDEFMFEESSQEGYRKMTSSWPFIKQLFLLAIPVVFFVFWGFSFANRPILNIPSYFGILLLIPLPLLLLIRKKRSDLPLGFIFFFISLLGILFLWMGKQTFETGIHVRAFIGLYHFMTWYVFYTKKLILKPKIKEKLKFSPLDLLFSYRRSPLSFWFYITIAQLATIGFLLIYLFSPSKLGTQYIFAEGWWQFWTIWHVTTSFVGKWQPTFALKLFWPKRQEISALPA